jgi:hypothetical protein
MKQNRRKGDTCAGLRPTPLPWTFCVVQAFNRGTEFADYSGPQYANNVRTIDWVVILINPGPTYQYYFTRAKVVNRGLGPHHRFVH